MDPATELPELLRAVFTALVRREGPDLTCRQLAVLLICYLEDGPHAVRDLVTRLAVEGYTVTRCIDRLEQFALATRMRDQNDRRSFLIGRTVAGHAFLAELQRIWRRSRRAWTDSLEGPAALATAKKRRRSAAKLRSV